MYITYTAFPIVTAIRHAYKRSQQGRQPFPILPPSPALGLVPAGTALIGALDLMGTHGDGSCIARVANSGNAAAPAFWAAGPRTYVAAATGAVPRAAWDIPPTSPAFAHGHFRFVPSGQRLGGAAKAKHRQTVPADVKMWPFHRAPPCWNGHALLEKSAGNARSHIIRFHSHGHPGAYSTALPASSAGSSVTSSAASPTSSSSSSSGTVTTTVMPRRMLSSGVKVT